MGKPGEKPSEHKRDQLQQLYTYMSCKFENQHGAIPCRGLCHAGGAGGLYNAGGYTMQVGVYYAGVCVCVCGGGGVIPCRGLYHAGGHPSSYITPSNRV